ncbi:serpin family protein [Dyadobacter sandarakinus]|uniref:Serpin family protein n=2 Tax=Dyadobacter sandarakinus TaxID=2747268 RepID=A0ABX7IDQ0_9BACT|nr:serpin family protein [Dyadobacter sandarakinus]
MLAGCTNDGPAPSDQVNPVEIPAEISNATTDFAFDFFGQVRQAEAGNPNIFVSPLSLHMALGMLLNGAENETAAQLASTLKADSVSVEKLNDAYKTLISKLPAADSRVILGLANSAWYDKNQISVAQPYQQLLKDRFDAQISGIPFDGNAADKINQWADDKTRGKIKKVINAIDPGQVMFLLNALYFKGDWRYKFDRDKTIDTPFRLENGTTKNVKMMYISNDFAAMPGSRYSAVKLPYGNGQFSMTLIIPRGSVTIGDVLSEITANDWKTLQSTGMYKHKARVGLPRFALNYNVKLNSTLENMGMKRIFTPQAQFGKITTTASLFVDFIKQDTYLGIDEQGTEAAAVTTIGISTTSMGPDGLEYICDRPFGLVISEETSKTILFMGQIKNPESK